MDKFSGVFFFCGLSELLIGFERFSGVEGEFFFLVCFWLIEFVVCLILLLDVFIMLLFCIG